MTLYRMLNGLFPMPFAAKVLMALWIGIAAALVVGVASEGGTGMLLIAALVGGVVGSALLLALLMPLRGLMASVSAWGRTGRITPLPEGLGDDMGLLLARINLLMARAQRTLDTSWSELDSDPLTGVTNAGGAARILRDAGAGWLIGIDLIALRLVSEGSGHKMADDMLIHVARTCTDIVRQDDMVARMDEGRFVIFLPGASREVAARIVRRIAGRIGPDGAGSREVQACYGITRYIGGGEVPGALDALGEALDSARSRGPGSVEGATEAEQSAA